MFWFIVLVILVFVVLLFNWSEAIYYKHKIKNQIKILPTEYECYIYVDKSTIRFGDHEMIFLFQSSDPIKNYLTADNNLIVIANQKIGAYEDNDLKYTLYKYDPLGNLISTLSYEKTHYLVDDQILIEGYLIHLTQNYYRTWAIDGDISIKEMIIENENFEWSEEEQIAFFDVIKNESIRFFTHYHDLQPHDCFNKIFYFQNNKWVVFYRKKIKYSSLFDSKKEVKWLYNLFDYYYTTEKNWSVNPFENIQFVYFHKKNFESHSTYGGGGSGLASSSRMGAYWKGDLYTHLIVDGDTLKFKDELLLELSISNGYFMIGDKRLSFTRNPKTSITPFLYYSNLALEYKLFTKDERQLYMIKKVVN